MQCCVQLLGSPQLLACSPHGVMVLRLQAPDAVCYVLSHLPSVPPLN